MNEIQAWDFDGTQVRTAEIDGDVWFVGADVCAVLGYINSRDALAKHVPETEKRNTVANRDGNTRGNPNMTVINESGLYRLIFSSKMPSAQRFTDWVTHEVLPQIRRTGMYTPSELLDNPEMYLKTVQRLVEERREREKLQARNTILEPKAAYYDVCLNTSDGVSVTQIAKEYGHSAQWLNQYLHAKGVQYKCNGTWVLYEKYADAGYTNARVTTYTASGGVHTSEHTYWTQKGRKFIYELLKEDEIYPVAQK